MYIFAQKITNKISIQIVSRYITFRFLSKTLMNSVVARTNHLSCHVLIFDERGTVQGRNQWQGR